MDRNGALFSIGLLVAFCLLKYGEAIRCYVCSSHYDPSCGDPFFQSSVPLIDCSIRPVFQYGLPTMCKKTSRRIGDGTYKITRDCALNEFQETDDEGNTCVTTPNGEFSCRCFGDACNGATKATRLSLVTMATVTMIITVFFTNRGV